MDRVLVDVVVAEGRKGRDGASIDSADWRSRSRRGARVRGADPARRKLERFANRAVNQPIARAIVWRTSDPDLRVVRGSRCTVRLST